MSSVTIHKYSLYYYFFLPFTAVVGALVGVDDLRPPPANGALDVLPVFEEVEGAPFIAADADVPT